MHRLLLSLGLLFACSQTSATDGNANKTEQEPTFQGVPSPTPTVAASAAPVTRDDAAMPPAERRLEPVPGWNPSHATLRLLRKIGEGDWKLAPFINAKRGVFVYRESL